MKRFLAAVAVSLGLTAAQPVLGQGSGNIVHITRDVRPTTMQPGEYYTHVLVDLPDFTVPSDDNGQEQIGKAILSAFGLGDKTRSITITLTLTYKGDPLPAIPLITYTFDGKKRLTNYQRIGSYLSPAWQVDAATPITAKLTYLYSEQTSFDPKTISDSVSQVIPSAAIVSTLSKPFVQSLVGLTTSIFGIAGSRSINSGYQDYLFPYQGAVGARALTFSVATPAGDKLGDIRLSLVASPTLGRAPILAVDASPANLVKPEGEGISDLALDQGGSSKLLLNEAEGMPEYLTMAQDRTDASVRVYCRKANTAFAGYGLTLMDRTTVIFQSLLDTGFTTDANSWLLACFTPGADRVALTRARGVSFAPANPDPDGAGWPVPLKQAMGCWVTNQSGPYCQQHAPTARATLETAMKDQVRIGVIDLKAVDTSVLPIGRIWTKSQLLDAIGGKAEGFSCFRQGLILTSAGAAFSLGVSMQGDKIATFQILAAAPDAAQCLGS